MISRRPGLKREEYRAAVILLLPASIGLILFSFIPILQALQLSFYDAPLLSTQRTFVGLENYATALSDPVFIRAMLNTVVYAVEAVILQVLVALALALLIRNYYPGIGFFRSAYFLPVVTSLVVVSTVWKIMYHTENGLINSVLRTAALPSIPWLTSPDVALWSIVILGLWKEVGFSMLVLLGGLHSIPRDYYEAAAIDGATGGRSFWHITLPLLRRAMLFVVVLSTINAFKLFTPVYVMPDGGPSDSTQTMVFYIFQSVFRYFKMGYASALSFLLLILVLILAAIQFRLFRSDVEN
ncbi:MAG: sugar ABC transporter permease [Planctomycetota bacterium]|nr:MAG: sugar ABC transporter permease [Planctomycetota bacterium]